MPGQPASFTWTGTGTVIFHHVLQFIMLIWPNITKYKKYTLWLFSHHSSAPLGSISSDSRAYLSTCIWTKLLQRKLHTHVLTQQCTQCCKGFWLKYAVALLQHASLQCIFGYNGYYLSPPLILHAAISSVTPDKIACPTATDSPVIIYNRITTKRARPMVANARSRHWLTAGRRSVD